MRRVDHQQFDRMNLDPKIQIKFVDTKHQLADILHISTAYVHHLDKDARQKFGRKPGDKMEDLDVNTSIWRIFMTATLRAAVHLGNDYVVNLHSTKNQSKRTLKLLFNATSLLNFIRSVHLGRLKKQISSMPCQVSKGAFAHKDGHFAPVC